MAKEPESLMLHLLRQMREELAGLREASATKADFSTLRSEIAEVRSELKSDMHSLRADMAADLLQTRKELSEQIGGLRRAVVDYHTSVVGHGVLISDLDARLPRVEMHLDLPPMTTG